jgi:glycosyl transferase family 2
VTPLLDPASDVVDTVESVMRQEGAEVEHIVIASGSMNGTRERLGRYPHLKLVSEPGRSHADLVNRGFHLATGQIWGMLSPDDALLPAALDRVAREMDPPGGRHIVMGRCRVVDEQGRFTGIEHPSQFESHRRVLEVWKGQSIPPPALFWTPHVWRTCGPVDESVATAGMDYDIFCRFSRAYPFHFVDQVLATHRLHAAAPTVRSAEVDRLEYCIGLSRRYWGSPFAPTYWQLTLSLARFRLDRVGRARRQVRQGKESWRQGRLLSAAAHVMAGTLLAPRVGFSVGLYPALRNRTTGIWRKTVSQLEQVRGLPAETVGYLGRTDAWADGWVGPRFVLSCEAHGPVRAVDIRGWTDLRYLGRSLVLTVRVDQQMVGQHRIRRPGNFAARVALPATLAPGAHTVEIEASAWFVPGRFTGNADLRPLAWRVVEVSLDPQPARPA